ncbi:MAG: hypothetical protein SPH68_00990 [Candidatus Borkfalkiaceae bacterium]|nr:hypothetical protein [Clostridia bacterium]MDY6222721.1 hypothetical protein [Christensenellaceae bacterium]
MKQIELVLQNDGVKRNVIFPCTESEYQTTCKELELKDNYAFVRDVVEPKVLALKKDTFVNFDEINYLAKRMDSFDQKELFSFFAAVEAGNYVLTKDLINLTFNLNCYTLIRDVSNLKNIGYPTSYKYGEKVTISTLKRDYGCGGIYHTGSGSPSATYRFSGWYLDWNLTQPFTGEFPAGTVGDIVLYADITMTGSHYY